MPENSWKSIRQENATGHSIEISAIPPRKLAKEFNKEKPLEGGGNAEGTLRKKAGSGRRQSRVGSETGV